MPSRWFSTTGRSRSSECLPGNAFPTLVAISSVALVLSRSGTPSQRHHRARRQPTGLRLLRPTVSDAAMKRRHVPRTILGAVLMVSLTVGASSCSSGPSTAPPSTASQSAAAKAICASVAQALNAGPDKAVALSLQTIANGEQSGDTGLDAASRSLLQAVSQPGGNQAAVIKDADQRVQRACIRLGIWRTGPR
jgi:hypothetical protein